MSTTNNGAMTRTPQAGMTSAESFDGSSVTALAETNQSGMSARATAMAQAKYIVAMQRPRNMDLVRTKMLRAIERPGFAGLDRQKSKGTEAWYHKPVGEGVQGFSIRFAEEAMRCLGNMEVQSTTLLEDASKRVIEIAVIDYEANNVWSTTATIEKTVERKRLPAGEIAIRVRTNAHGDPVYTLPATPDDVFTEQGRITSKLARNGILRQLPGDIQEECRRRILEIRRGAVAADPDGFKRKVLDSFAKLNITAPMLEKYLGQTVDTASPDQLQDLRDLWQEIDEGKTTWAREMAETDPGPKSEPTPVTQTTLDDVAAKLSAKSAAEAIRKAEDEDAKAPEVAPAVEDEERAALRDETPAPAPAPAKKPAAPKKAEPAKPLEEDDTFKRFARRGGSVAE